MKTNTKVWLLTLLLVSINMYAQKPNIWIHTDMTSALSYTTTSTTSEANTDQNSDPDDHAALAQYLLLANRFNTVHIVVGVTNRDTDFNTGTFVQNTFIDGAYASDYPGLNNTIGGYPSPSSIKVSESSLTAGSGYINFSNTPDTKYDDYNSLPGTVKLLVDELNKSTYSSTNPLYVLVWGGLQEVAMATKHLIRNGNTAALNRLFVVSHWTMSYINQGTPSDPYDVANCNASSAACDYMHNMAKASGAAFKFVDCGSSGQGGIVNGSGTFFTGGITGANATQLKKSKLGALAVKSKFVYGKIDGSDCASYYTVLGTYGVSLSSFANNGATTQVQEQNAIDTYKNTATDIWNDLLAASNAAIGGGSSAQAPSGLSATAADGSVTIRWDAITAPEFNRYAVHRGTSMSNIGWIKGSIYTTSYTDATVTNGTTYYYKVEAIYDDGTKVLSDETVQATPGGSSNQPPVANAGANQTVTDTDNSGSETVTLNGSTSSDSDGTITSYVWTEGGSQIATGATPNVTLSVGVHNLTLTVTDNDGATDTDGVTITVNAGITCTVPSPFISEDIGNTSVPGTGCESNGTFTLEGDGADIWGTADAFHYVYQSLSGDGEIIARVTSLENTNAWAKAGVMIRENNAAGSKHAMMIVTPGNGTAFQRRVTTNGTSLNTAAGDGLAAPVWVKMERSGSTLTGSKSTDGNTWTVVGSETISMTSDVLVGLCVTSHTTAAQATATFTNVSINNASIPDGAVAPEAGITVRLQNVETGLQLRPQSYADHAKLEGVTGDATSATEWTIEAINGYYRFVSVPANRRIRPTANEENSPAELGLTSWTGDWTQWTLTEVSTLTYRLINKQTGAYLKMESSSQGALCVHTTSASNATLWQLIGEGGTVPSCTPNAYDSEFLASANDANSGGMNTSTWCTDHIGQIDGGEWIAFNNICFGDGLASVTINATSGYDRPGSKAEIRLGSPTGQLIASIDVPNLNNWCGYTDFSANVSGVSGEHDVYVVFVGTTDIFDLHSVSFSQTLKSARPAENISQNVSDEIRVYPNPASEMVTVSGLQEGAILQVYNLQGQVVYTLIADGNQAEITNPNMQKGMYIVQINQNGVLTTKRIMFE